MGVLADTDCAPGEFCPGRSWSPDGTRIAYLNEGIWVVNADGTNQQQLIE